MLLFWSAACVAAFVCAGALLLDTLHLHERHSVSFTLDTAYLHWDTRFPAISVCEIESSNKVYDRATVIFGKDRNKDIDLFIRDIAFFSGTCFTCTSHCEHGMVECPSALANLSNLVRSECNELLINCVWNGEDFPCCQWFQPIHTELGVCFTINSLLTPNETAVERMVSNIHTGPGVLQFDAQENIKVYLHAREAVPYYNQPREENVIVYWGTKLDLHFSIKHIENDPDLYSVSSVQRGCILQEEAADYSYSACVVECHARAQRRLCNCTHHLMPGAVDDTSCDIQGLQCLTEHAEELRSVRTDWFTEKNGLVCECAADCGEPELGIVWKHTSSEDKAGVNGASRVAVKMNALPTMRYQRAVVRSKLDLVVSMGSAVGLFLGASLLSLVEAVYLCCRPSLLLQ